MRFSSVMKYGVDVFVVKSLTSCSSCPTAWSVRIVVAFFHIADGLLAIPAAYRILPLSPMERLVLNMARNFDLGQFRALVDHPGIENTPVFARPISGHPPYSGSIAAHRPASRKH